MNKAEELATRLYPVEIDTRWGPLPGGGISEVDVNKVERLACIKGYEAAQKDLGWISVKERLPDEEGWYFACLEVDGHPRFVRTSYFDVGRHKWLDEDDEEIPVISHWMPIPELPKEK